MEVLVVSQHYWPESFRINELVSAMLTAGCRVTVLTGQPNYPDGRVFPGYSAFKVTREQHAQGYSIMRVPLIPRGRATAWKLVANYCSFVVSASVLGPWLLRNSRVSAIFVFASSPILQVIPAIVIARIKRIPLVTWVQDLWPESLEVTGFVKSRSLLAMVEKVVRWIYRQNDLLMVQSRGFLASVSERAAGVPVEYFPNPGDAAFLEQSSSTALTLPPGFNVLFAGNLGIAQGLDSVIAAAELLRDQPDVRFVLVGSGSRMEWLRSEIEKRRLENVMLAGRFPASAMPGILAQASALLVSLVRSPTMSQTIPTKLQAYLAAARPIIAALDGEGAAVVREAGAGISCPPEEPTALAAAIRRLHASSPEQLAEMGSAGRAYYLRHFDPDVLARQLTARLQLLAHDFSAAT
jgi:glycosyltransferase involved in cell wall biosynthesis